MTRLAIIAPRSVQEDVIEALHSLRLAHLEAYAKGEDEELDIGEPLPRGESASETLVRLRAVLHTLDLEGEPSRRLEQEEIHARLDNELPRIEDQVEEAAEHRDDIRSQLDEVRDEIGRLEPLARLPLDLEDYRGYETIEVFVGYAREDLTPELSTAIERFESFPSDEAHAVFVHEDEAEKAQEILTREGFQSIDPPTGEGSPADRLAELERQARDLEQALARAEAQLDDLAEEHRDLLLAAEEDLDIEVEKAEAPLDFASTERTVIVDAWVPTEDLDAVKTTVGEAARGRVAFEIIDDGDRDEHDREQAPPSKYDHPKGVSRFGFLLDLFGRPNYDEIDPTWILFLVFPLFFGFMIGDLGYGILMIGLGLLLYRRLGDRSPAAGSLGFALLLSGIWAALFGAIVFHDLLGIPFAAHGDGHGLNWEGMLGIHLNIGDPMLQKLGDDGVKGMLALSILAAFVHLLVGFIFAFINHLGHHNKHALAQVGWISVLCGLGLLAIFQGPVNSVSGLLVEGLGFGTVEWTGHGPEAMHLADNAMSWVGYLLAPGVLLLVLTEGPLGLMETFGLLSNIISYTRLAGVAVAKGAMVGAFNQIFLQDMVLTGTSIALIVTGFVLFIIAQMIVFILGLLSSGIQSIRLNYVEFFLKFYEGSGETFEPFGRERRFTTNPRTEPTN